MRKLPAYFPAVFALVATTFSSTQLLSNDLSEKQVIQPASISDLDRKFCMWRARTKAVIRLALDEGLDPNSVKVRTIIGEIYEGLPAPRTPESALQAAQAWDGTPEELRDHFIESCTQQKQDSQSFQDRARDF